MPAYDWRMAADSERDVHCPRCAYNLRGLTTPRCPECGFEFSFAEFETGMLRENIPTWLDRCDLWQPHQVLAGSLYELVRGTMRPRRLLAKLDVNGPLVPALLMLVCGALWLWLLTSVISAIAIVVHEDASPAVALKAGALVWGLRLVTASLMLSLVLVAPVLTSWFMHVAKPTAAQRFRLGAYLCPAIASYGCIPVAVGLCVEPESAPALRFVCVFLPVLMCLLAGRRRSSGASGDLQGKGTRHARRVGAWLRGGVGSGVVGTLAGHARATLVGLHALKISGPPAGFGG